MESFHGRNEKSGLWEFLSHVAFRTEIFVGVFLLVLTAFGIISL